MSEVALMAMVVWIGFLATMGLMISVITYLEVRRLSKNNVQGKRSESNDIRDSKDCPY
jgi:hypothetical protein